MMQKKLRLFTLFLILFSFMALSSKTSAQDINSLSQAQVQALIESQKSAADLNKATVIKEGSGEIEYSRDETATSSSNSAPVIDSLSNEGNKIMVFGQNIFQKDNLTFAPSYSIPTPKNYVVSAGDELIVEIWGDSEARYALKVSPEGNINIPRVGVVNLNGLNIDQVEAKITSQLLNAFEGIEDGTIHLNVSLGNIRSIKVNIIGEAYQPGTYTLPSLATMFNALYTAGGVNDIGSLRNIKLYRNNKLVSTLDVYDYLIDGKTDVDQRLEDGDMLIVSPYENVVTIAGQAKRPMKYEMIKGETVATALEYAGGYTSGAYKKNLTLTREAGGKNFTIFTVEENQYPDFELMDGDNIEIGNIVEEFENRVSIEGAVYRVGNYELSDKISTVRELIEVSEGVTPYAFMARAQIVRINDDKSLQVIPFHLGRMLSGDISDIDLKKDDRVVIASINELKENEYVSIRGEVNEPLEVPFAEQMTIEDLILMAKGMKHSASLARVEVARRIKDANSLVAGDERAELFTFSISEDLEIDESASTFYLMPYDEVFVRRSPSYQIQTNLFVTGEVNFPGEYTMKSSYFTLYDLVEAAGGITNLAYVKGAVLYRTYTDDDIQKMLSLKKLAEVANREQSVAASDGTQAASLGSTGAKVGDKYSVGIDLVEALRDPSSLANLTLRKDDILNIPVQDNTVSIMGAVYYPTSTTYNPKYSVRDYIKMAGDYSELAKRRPFVIFMNGDIKTLSASSKKLEPGCKVVVPYKVYREPMNTQGWISIASSVVSMAAMVTSLIK